MNTRDEMAGESVTEPNWSGFDQLRLTDDENSVLVTVGSRDRWDKSHLRRLRQSADLPGLVPVVDADAASDGKPYAVTPVVDTETLADRLPPSASEWSDCAAITEAAARATHEAHLRGLFHGALSPDQIHVLDNDVAVSGVGLGLGGHPTEAYDHWAAPEVLEGADPTERSDVYSLGKVLEASLGESIDDVPRSVRRLIMWSSSDTPEARPPSALEFASILAEAMGEDRASYSPAFIPTAEITDLASTASEAVAAHVPSAQPASGSSRAGTVAGGLAAAAGAGALAASLSGDDDTADVDPLADVEGDAGDVTEAGDLPTEGDAPSILDDATSTEDLDASTAEADVDATTTADIEPGPETGAVADTGGVSFDDLEAGVNVGNGFDSRQYTDPVDTADEEYDLPAAATTIDLDAPEEDRRGNRAGILVGAILAAGLGLVAFQLLNSDDDDGAAEDDVAAAADDGEEDGTTTDEADDAAATDGTDGEDGTDGDTATDEATTDGEEDGDDAGATDGTDGEDDADDGSEDASANAGDDEATEDDGDAATDDEAQPSTSTTAQPTTSTTAQPTTSTTVTTTSTTEAPTTTTTEAPTTTSEAEVAVDASPTVDGPITADEAAIQILHGIPGVDADVYVDGQALAPGFTAGTIAGPAELDPGTYDIAVYAASDAPPVAAADRDDDPLIAETVTVGDAPATLVAHLDGDGNPSLSAFPENLSTLAAGKSRVELRHLAAAPAVQLTVDGEASDDLLEPGQSASLVLDAGDHTIDAATADGDPVTSATITVADGELASISLIGTAENGIEVAIQRYTGLGSAPASVPTGDSNLLGDGEDPTGLYLLAGLASLMAAAGGLVMMRRSRQVL